MSYSLKTAKPIGIQLSIKEETPLWEQGLFVLWMFTLFLRIPQFSLLMFACLLAILGLFAFHAPKTVPALLRAWPILLYPFLGGLSIGWSAYPSQAISQTVFLVLTPIILITIAVRLRPKEFFRCMTIGGALATAYLSQPSIAFHGPGAIMHKQVLAYHLLLICIPCLVSAANNNELLPIRILGLITAVLAFSLQFVADSVTSIALTLLAFLFIFVVKFVWLPFSQINHLRTLTFLIACIFACIGMIAVLSLPQNSFVEDAFDMVGKDTTLTGRTIIWEFAAHACEKNPIFGQGLGAFWHPDVGLAQTLAEETHMKPGTNISFHSVYWEMRVHLGWVGLAVISFALSWTIWLNFRQWLRDPSILNSGMLALLVVTLSTVMTESYLTGAFDLVVTSFYFGALSVVSAREQKHTLRATIMDSGRGSDPSPLGAQST